MVENDTLIICKDSHKDNRQYVIVSSESSTQKSFQTSSQNENLPRIYFVTPVSVVYFPSINIHVNKLFSFSDLSKVNKKTNSKSHKT